MDGFLTSSFIQKFPDCIKQSLFASESSFYKLLVAIKSGHLRAGTQGQAFVSVLEVLKKNDPELYNIFMSLEASGNLITKDAVDKIPEYLKGIKIRKTVLKRISEGYSHEADVIYHDIIKEKKWKEEIIRAGNKPIIDNDDLRIGNLNYFFKEASFPLNHGKEFNWSRFLINYTYPFQRVRILDPYLYSNINDIDLTGIIKTLLSQSTSKDSSIEIISDLSANSRERKEDVKEKVIKSIDLPSNLKTKVKLYTQRGSASNIFHKRVIWTDFWVLNAERGFDFLKLEKGKGTVTRENTLFMTGKYSSKDSLWHQVKNNWENYLKNSSEIRASLVKDKD